MNWMLENWPILSACLALLGSGAVEARWRALSRLGHGLIEFARCQTKVITLQADIRTYIASARVQDETTARILKNLEILEKRFDAVQNLNRETLHSSIGSSDGGAVATSNLPSSQRTDSST